VILEAEKMDEVKKPEIKIELDENTAQGVYSNLAMISHTADEFVIDFVFLQPQNPKAKVRSRVVTSPGHAKRLLTALKDNIAKYEARFGELKTAPKPGPEKKVEFYH
jgi:hypothetical protein